MVLRVRDRLEVLRPVRAARSCREFGWVAAITFNKSRFLFDSTLAKLSGEVNQTLGSSLDGLRRPRAIAIVRFFMSSMLAIPTFSVFILSLLVRARPHRPRSKNQQAGLPRPGSRKAEWSSGGACDPAPRAFFH